MATKLPAAKLAQRVAFQRLVEQVAAILVTGDPTVFRYEAELRHHFRSHWCLEGMRWQLADDRAVLIVDQALRRLKAVRPTWREGQNAFATMFCANESCAVTLKADATSAYCSDRCKNIQDSRVWERRQTPQKLRARERLANERWAAKQEPRDCPGCDGTFVPKFRDKPNYQQKYCDAHCYQLHRKKIAAAAKAEKAAMKAAIKAAAKAGGPGGSTANGQLGRHPAITEIVLPHNGVRKERIDEPREEGARELA